MNELRGSEELYKRLGEPPQISKDELTHLVRSAEATSAKILDWTVFGRPALERVRASFELQPEHLPAFVEKVLSGKSRFHWEVFPQGVPPLIDRFRVVLDNNTGPV